MKNHRESRHVANTMAHVISLFFSWL